jgi:hypothetical protein
MPQMIKHLPSKGKALSSSSSTAKKKRVSGEVEEHAALHLSFLF